MTKGTPPQFDLAGIRSDVTSWHATRHLPSPVELTSVQLLWDGAKQLTGKPAKHYQPFPYQKWLYMVKVLLQRGRLIDFRDVVWLCPAFLGFSRHSEIIGRKLEPEFARGFRFCDIDLSGQLFQKQHCSGSPPGPGFRSPPLQIVPCQHIVVAAKAVPLVCAVTSAGVYSSCCRMPCCIEQLPEQGLCCAPALACLQRRAAAALDSCQCVHARKL